MFGSSDGKDSYDQVLNFYFLYRFLYDIRDLKFDSLEIGGLELDLI